MPDNELIPPSDTVRVRMEQQRRRDTAPEMLLRRELHSRGLRYRLGVKVPGAPRRTIDIAFTRARVAVFVDGCFWHKCPIHHVPAKNNSEWWAAKLAANVQRDRGTDALLRSGGWRVVRCWEHEDMRTVAIRVCSILTTTRGTEVESSQQS